MKTFSTNQRVDEDTSAQAGWDGMWLELLSVINNSCEDWKIKVRDHLFWIELWNPDFCGNWANMFVCERDWPELLRGLCNCTYATRSLSLSDLWGSVCVSEGFVCLCVIRGSQTKTENNFCCHWYCSTWRSSCNMISPVIWSFWLWSRD